MKRIFKYPLQLCQREMLQMPEGAKILDVVYQNEIPVLFALVDDKAPLRTRIIRTVTTGEQFNPEGCEFIRTINAGKPTWFVAHIYEQTQKTNDPRSDRFKDDFDKIAREIQIQKENL